jgi:hypothetical protein
MNIMYRLLLFLFVVLLGGVTACKKEPAEDPFTRGGNSLLLTADGSLLIAGFDSYKTSGEDAVLIKTDLSGNVIWRNQYGTSANDGFYAVRNTPDGGYIAAGFTNNSTNVRSSILLVKTDEKGNQVWKASFGDQNNAQALGVVPSGDEGYVSCGFIQGSTSDARDMYFVKVNSKGEKVWEKSYGTKSAGNGNDIAYSIIRDSDGGFLVTGTTKGKPNCCGQACLFKLSASGDSLWTKTYSGETGYSIAKVANGDFIIGGTYLNLDDDNSYLLRVDASGNKLWEQNYGGDKIDYGTSVVACSDGGFALTGITASNSAGNHDIFLLRTNSGGAQTWLKLYGGTGIDQGYGLIQQADDGLCITGSMNSGGSFVFLNKTDASGTELWSKFIK